MKLKPCPFCGEAHDITINEVYIDNDDPRSDFNPAYLAVECKNCGARGPLGDTKAQRVKGWNDATHRPSRPARAG